MLLATLQVEVSQHVWYWLGVSHWPPPMTQHS
jgi:hypothetical protein